MLDTGTRRVRKNNRFNLGSKCLKNAQLHDEIMRSWGIGGSALNKPHVYFGGTDALLARVILIIKTKRKGANSI